MAGNRDSPDEDAIAPAEPTPSASGFLPITPWTPVASVAAFVIALNPREAPCNQLCVGRSYKTV